MTQWLSGRNPSINGSVLKTSILIKMYNHAGDFWKHHGYFHEDVLSFLILMLIMPEVTILSSNKQLYKANILGANKDIIIVNKWLKRYDTLVVGCLYCEVPQKNLIIMLCSHLRKANMMLYPVNLCITKIIDQ